MANLNFILIGLEEWDVESAHTGLFVGTIQYNLNWQSFSFLPVNFQLDSVVLREIAKFLDEQEQIKNNR